MPNRRSIAVLAAAIATLGGAAAHAQTVFDSPPPAIIVPVAEARAVFGLGTGIEAAASILDHRLRLDGGLHGWHGGGYGELAALVRVAGPATSGVWLRAGYMFQAFETGCDHMPDAASSYDAGVAYRKRWAGGSLFAAEGGFEMVSRDAGLVCNDSVVSARSAGLRVGVGGQYAITRWLGLYARVGVRSADHMLEIHMLPQAWAGLAFEI